VSAALTIEGIGGGLFEVNQASNHRRKFYHDFINRIINNSSTTSALLITTSATFEFQKFLLKLLEMKIIMKQKN
jgi:hypothetical protein